MREAATILIENQSGEVFLQHRDAHAPIDPHTWGLWGGAVERGEKPSQTAIRELKEELGIDITENDLRFLKEYQGTYGNEELREHVFFLHDHGQFQYVLGEGDDMKFFSKADILSLPLENMSRIVLQDYFSRKNEH